MNSGIVYIKQFTITMLNRPAEIFVLLALIFGSIFIFRLAPLNGTDEFTHFPRVYQISQGIFFEQRLPGNQYGGYLPANINNMINDYRNLSRESPGSGYNSDTKSLNNHYDQITVVGHNKEQAIFTSVVMYPPWAYSAPLIGLLVAKFLSLPLLWYVFMARISALLIWIFLTWLAIRTIPEGKWFILALALLPTTLTQAATVSADGLLIGLSWLLIALSFAAIAGKVKLSWPKLILISALSLGVSIIKDGYFLVGLFPLVIPLSRFASKSTGKLWKIITFLVTTSGMLLFTIRTAGSVSGLELNPTVGMYMNSTKQISYISHHLVLFLLRVVWQPFTKSFDTTYLGIVGIFTNRLIYLSIFIISLLVFGLYLGLINTNSIKSLIHVRYRLWIFGAIIFLGTYILLATAFYIGNTAVGAQYVNGFYGRYFLPIIPLFLILPMTIKRKQIARLSYKVAIVSICLIGLISTITSIG